MNLQHIRPALIAIENNPVVNEPRSHTYLSTYPNIMQFVEPVRKTHNITATQFRLLALLVYGWMPRVLRIYPDHLEGAVQAVNDAMQIAEADQITEATIQSVADCLNSVVGVSKMLHFINPDIFPIWDSTIQAFRGFPNNSYQMAQVNNYLQYVREVHAIIAEPGFDEFYHQYNEIHFNRLEQSGIDPYAVGQVRAIEASAFELARRAI